MTLYPYFNGTPPTFNMSNIADTILRVITKD